MPTDELAGRALATRRAAADITRAAVLGSYGVAGFEAGVIERIHAAFVGRTPGIRIAFAGNDLAIHLTLRVTRGLPVAEVARQVDSAVRYGIRRALGREVDDLHIRIGGFDASPGTQPPDAPTHKGMGSSELADSGTDVA